MLDPVPVAAARPDTNVQPFNPFLETNSPALNQLCELMLNGYWQRSIQLSQTRQRQLRGPAYTAFKTAHKALIINLFNAWQKDSSRGIRLSMRDADYTSATAQYRHRHISLHNLRTIIQDLERTGDIRVETGSLTDRLQTRIFPIGDMVEHHFIYHNDMEPRGSDLEVPEPVYSFTTSEDFPVIRLKKRVAQTVFIDTTYGRQPRTEYQNVLVPYTVTPAIKRMAAQVKVINRHLTSANLNIMLSDADLVALNRRLQVPNWRGTGDEEEGAPKAPLNLNTTALYRVFNNERWDNGGRFYGGWWQGLPKRKYRKLILIDDEPTIEVDYSGLHVVMLYQHCGLEYDQDLPENADAYFDAAWFPDQPDARELYRETFKRIWQRMLNAKGDGKPDEEWELPPGWTFTQMEQALIAKHPRLVAAGILHSGIGIHLQYQDSQVAQAVLESLRQQGIVALPVHDSFIVKARHHVQLVEAMRDQYKRVLGLDYAPNKDPSQAISPEEYRAFKERVGATPSEFIQYRIRAGIRAAVDVQ